MQQEPIQPSGPAELAKHRLDYPSARGVDRLADLGSEHAIPASGIGILRRPASVTVRKDDAPAADQAAITNVAGLISVSCGGGLIKTTPG